MSLAVQAVATGHAAISQMCKALTQWAAEVGKQPKRPERLLPPEGLEEQFSVLTDAQVDAAFR
jgi:polyribonucleotide nucleotidyltransferase